MADDAGDRDGTRGSKPIEQALRALEEADDELSSLVAVHGLLLADARRLSKLAIQLSHAIGDAEADVASPKLRQQLQELITNSNLMRLQIGQNIDEESRRFTLLSNIMKTKHDTAKNSISNIR